MLLYLERFCFLLGRIKSSKKPQPAAKAARLIAAAACALALCSCGAVSISGTESLLEAPKLNKRQNEVSKALESTLSLRSIVYKYPRSGEYRSPFIFFDFDGDLRDEAIVFYSYSGEAAGTVRAKILKQHEDGAWFPFYDIPSQSPGVEFVQFEKLLDAGSYCMVIGWQGDGRQLSVFDIYSLRDGQFQMEATCEYIYYSIRDFNGNGLAEAVIIARESARGKFKVSLLSGRDGRIETTGSLELASEAESVLALTTGGIWDNSMAVYIDEALSGGPASMIATEVIRVSAGRLERLCGGDEQGSAARSNYELTFRDEDILCMDFDADGTVEVPYPVPLPGSVGTGGSAAPSLVRFMRVTRDGFSANSSAVINRQAGYFVYFPDRWIDKVMVDSEQGDDEWSFRKWNQDIMEPAEELLRVRVSYGRDYMDMFEDYTELMPKGATTYAAYIPGIPGEPLAVGEHEVRRMFRLLPS